MKRILSIILISGLFVLFGLSTVLAENVTESELVGVWQFVGGGEVMGDGFRLNADGTGQGLEADYTEGYPKHLQATGTTFQWRVEDDIFVETIGGASFTYPVAWYDHRIHFAEGESGGFYQKYDEDAIRTEIEERNSRGEMTEFDALVLDYIADAIEPTLAERLHLRSVVALVDWYSEEKSVTVSAWSLDLDESCDILFTESDTTVTLGTAESSWTSGAGIGTNLTAQMYYQVAAAALNSAKETYTEQQMLTSDVTPSAREPQPGEAAVIAEIEQKRAEGTTDDFDNLAMDAMDGTMTARLEAMGLTDVSTRLNWNGSLHFILAWGWDSATHFRVALRFTPCAIGVCVGDEVGDVTQIPVSWYANSLRSVDQGVYEDAWLFMQSELALVSQQQQTLFSMPGLSGYVGQFPRGKTYEVYRGPGQEYGRSANGKASVSTNDSVWVYGVRTPDGWMLISYGISGGRTRYGWIRTAGLPDSMFEYCPELTFPGDDWTDYVYATVRENTRLMDVMGSDKDSIYLLQPGDSVHCLAGMNGWVLIDFYASEQHYMGFVRWDSLDLNHGAVMPFDPIIEQPSVWSEEEIRAAMQAVADGYIGSAAGHTLISLWYSDEENHPDSVDMPTDEPDGIEWIKLHGVARSIAYYDFEIADSNGIADDLSFYVWREPGGEWIGGIGGYE